MGTRWRGLLAPINKPTGDGRRMAAGAMRWRALPLGLKWQRDDDAGHDSSVIIGSTDAINIGTRAQAIAGGWISAEGAARTKLGPGDVAVWGAGELFDDIAPQGMPRLAEDVAEAILLTEKGVIGPSVDAGAASVIFVRAGTDTPLTGADWDELLMEEERTGLPAPIEMLFTDYEIAAATLVSVPAFAEAQPFELTPTALTATVTGAVDLPVAARDAAWDATAAAGRIFDHYTRADDGVDVEGVGRGFLYRDPDGDPTQPTAYLLGFADIIDDELRIVPRGLSGAASTSGVDATDIPAAEKVRIHTRLCNLYARVREVYADWPACPFDDATAARVNLAVALTAAAAPVLPAEAFAAPPTPPPYRLVTVEPAREGEPFERIAGYAAPFGTCHAQYRDVCLSAPPSATDYALFHRTPINTTEGLLAVGRVTTGHGRVGTGCTHLACRGKDDHACDQMDLATTLSHYDALTTLAHVRATEYPGVGIWIQGVLAAGVSDADRAVLARQRVSGDWRDNGGGLEMVEVLALGRDASRPGFPIPATALREGRQLSLTAVVARMPDPATAVGAWPPAAWAENVADLVVRRLAAAAPPTVMMPGMPPEDDMPPEDTPQTGAMVALRMTPEAAGAMAVPGGEPPDQLHITMAYLGEGDTYPPETQASIIEAMRGVAAGFEPFDADPFAASLFNPDDPTASCVVMGMSGPELAPMHEAVMAGLEPFVAMMPEQHSPYIPHVTLEYTPDPSAVLKVVDRAGTPCRIDMLRVAFAGVETDIPLGGGDNGPMTPEATPGMALLQEVLSAVDGVDGAERQRVAVGLADEIEAVGAGV